MRTRTGVCCAAVLCALAVWPPAASAGNVVSGEIADARGDSIRIPGVAPNDLASFGVRSTTQASSARGTRCTSHTSDTTPRDEFVGAHVGRWSRHLQSCDITTDGAASFRTSLNHDAPVPWSWIDYSVAGWGGFRSLPKTFPLPLPDVYEGWEFVMSDAGALAGRAYDCVTGVTLMGGGGDRGDVPVFCLGADGRVPCAGPPVAPPPAAAGRHHARGDRNPGPGRSGRSGGAGEAAPGAPGPAPAHPQHGAGADPPGARPPLGARSPNGGGPGSACAARSPGGIARRARSHGATAPGAMPAACASHGARAATPVAVRVSRRPASRGRASRAAGDERARGLPQRASAP